MGAQYNKIEKRHRRKRYKQRLKIRRRETAKKRR